jgi:precorrin-2 dehydrogenase/sirohydrochlorin ferrochelatase
MHYPVFLDLRERLCLIIGGNWMAEEKAHGLIAAGAVVTIVAPELTEGLQSLVDQGLLLHHPRDYQVGDLDGTFLVFSCAQPPHLAESIWREGMRRNLLINTVDDPPRCGFIMPSILRRGDLAVAISTAGKAPALAVRLRQWLETQIGEEHGRFLALAGTVRAALAQRWPDFATRKELWYRLVDSDVLDLLKRGEEEQAAGRFREILGVEPERGEAA